MHVHKHAARYAFLAFLFGCILFVMPRTWHLPPQWNPFLPLDVQAPLGPLTSWRMWRAMHDPQACRAALNTAGMKYLPVANQQTSQGCALHDAVRVEHLHALSLSSSFLASCPLALGMAMYNQHYLQPAALAEYGANVTEIVHVGSYACRNINHAANTTLSEHAFANAIDVEAYLLSNGVRISVAHDWKKDDRAGHFLTAAHDGACSVFHTVLGPDYNALHQSHFHLDMGNYRICR